MQHVQTNTVKQMYVCVTAGPCQPGCSTRPWSSWEEGFFFFPPPFIPHAWCWRARTKAHEGEPERARVAEIVQLICLCHGSPHLLSPPVQVRKRRREGDAAPQVSNSKAELKSWFLIRLEKVETKTIRPAHVVTDQSQGWATTRVIASSKNQGHHFLVMMLNIEVDHYFFLILHLGP